MALRPGAAARDHLRDSRAARRPHGASTADPADDAALAPKVAAIAMQRRGHAWQALPNITDGQETYELALTLTQIHDRWLVSHVSSETR